MQWRAFGDRMYLLARDIEFDVVAGILDVAHGQVV